MIEGLRGIRLSVPDLELARAWYAALFGVEPFEEMPGALVLAVPGGTLELVGAGSAPDSPGAIAMSHGQQVATPAASSTPLASPVTYWGVEHLGTELSRLADAGLRPVEPPRHIDAVTQVALFADPFGNLAGLMERDDPQVRRARSQRVAERVALRNVRGKVDEMADEQRQLENFGRRVIRVLAVVVIVLAGLFFLWRSARAGEWLDTPEAKQFRDRVVLLALIYGESNGIDPHGYMVRTKQLQKLEGGCGEVEVVTLQGEKEVRRETLRACRAH